MSVIWLSDCSKFVINWKNYNDVKFFWNDAIVKFFWRCFVSLFKFSYWSNFHVNIITDSGIMTIFFYKGFTWILKIKNTPIWVFWMCGDRGKVGLQNSARIFLIKFYWMLQNAMDTAFTVSELLRKLWLVLRLGLTITKSLSVIGRMKKIQNYPSTFGSWKRNTQNIRLDGPLPKNQMAITL